MKKDRIIAAIGFHGSLILALTIEDDILAGFMEIKSILWACIYFYLIFEKDKKI